MIHNVLYGEKISAHKPVKKHDLNKTSADELRTSYEKILMSKHWR